MTIYGATGIDFSIVYHQHLQFIFITIVDLYVATSKYVERVCEFLKVLAVI